MVNVIDPYYKYLYLFSVPVLSLSLSLDSTLSPLNMTKVRVEIMKRGHSQVSCLGGVGGGGQKETNLQNFQSCVSLLPRSSWGNVQPYYLRTKVDYLSSWPP